MTYHFSIRRIAMPRIICLSPLRLFALSLVSSATYAATPIADIVVPGTITPDYVALAKNPPSARACTGIATDVARLACFDNYFTQHTDAPAAQQTLTAGQDTVAPVSPKNADSSLLDQSWDLSKSGKTFNTRLYKPMYILPAFYTHKTNDLPHSPNPLDVVNNPIDNNHTEAKFQISVKTKVYQFDNLASLWFGYTQTSHWQIYNGDTSRPFRENNYEPEISLMAPAHLNILPTFKLYGLTLDHQSNGQSLPLSRSWNRAILNLGFEKDNWVVMLRPWYRIPETKADDDNPDISNYVGRGDLQITRKWDEQEFNLMLRHSLKTGSNSHGAMQFDWTFPIIHHLRGFVQIFDGYGESLIDYNHRSTYAGVGVSIKDWY
jgi:phospholipase A1